MKRIGYIGLSTPTFYDYSRTARRAKSDINDSPNPIIEGAFGAMLLYDELWFLCRSLCPQNMRSLPYVKFLDELGQAPAIDWKLLPRPDEVFQPTALADFSRSSSDFHKVKEEAPVYWEARIDSHTHGLKVGDFHLHGSSWTVKNVMYDLLLSERLPASVELITNALTTRLFKAEARTGERLKLVEVLVLHHVPQFLSPAGPYHPCIEDVRGSRFLSSFRKWITEEAVRSSSKDAAQVTSEVEAKLGEVQERIFLSYLDPRGSYASLAQTLIGVGVDALIPCASTIKDLIGQRNEEKAKQGIRWQGFIVEARKRVRALAGGTTGHHTTPPNKEPEATR